MRSSTLRGARSRSCSRSSGEQAAALAAKISGARKNELYALALELKAGARKD